MNVQGGAGEPAASGPPAPTKVIAVHLNYRSRAAERGRTPSQPSYFLKPSTSVSAGGELVQPQGTELLAYEGEVAIIIGRGGRDITPEQAPGHIGWYAPANDFGVHDFRWADRGSNLLAKGQDGFTPIGPRMHAAGVDPAALRLRTTVNGEPRQDTRGDELIFSPARLVADLSRFMTLEAGDVILAGTPSGTGVVGPGDTVEVSLDGAGTLTTTIVRSPRPLAPYGAMPKATPAARAYATGLPQPRAHEMSADTRAILEQVATATLTVSLGKHGIQRSFLSGLRPLRPDLRMVGYAHTLRYVALRADIRDREKGDNNAQKRAVESVRPDDVLIMETRGEPRAGTIGDILTARVIARGGAGVVTDGGIRDTPGVTALEIPSYALSAAAPSLWTRHVPMDIDVPITCAGVLVMPGDVIVGDAEGVVVIPAALAEQVAHDALETERRESWSLERVQAGESIRGVYPISKERTPEFERWLAGRPGGTRPDGTQPGGTQPDATRAGGTQPDAQTTKEA